MRWRARTIVRGYSALRARCPQLKRDSLGSGIHCARSTSACSSSYSLPVAAELRHRPRKFPVAITWSLVRGSHRFQATSSRPLLNSAIPSSRHRILGSQSSLANHPRGSGKSTPMARWSSGSIPRGPLASSSFCDHKATPFAARRSGFRMRKRSTHRRRGSLPGDRDAMPLPNKRLKLSGGDRSKGNGVLCAGAHELSFSYTAPCERVARSLSAIR